MYPIFVADKQSKKWYDGFVATGSIIVECNKCLLGAIGDVYPKILLKDLWGGFTS
jgi:hypothetical protein